MLLTRVTVVYALVIATWGCSQNSQTLNIIEGDWVALNLLEEGIEQDIDLSTVCLSFSKDNTYQYHGTLRYFESGTYDVKDNTLYVMPTGEGIDSVPRTMELVMLSQDTLRILMLDDNRERLITFVKANL